MFIACPDEKFPFKFDSLGGVRVITNEHSRQEPPPLSRLTRVPSHNVREYVDVMGTVG